MKTDLAASSLDWKVEMLQIQEIYRKVYREKPKIEGLLILRNEEEVSIKQQTAGKC